MSRSQSMPDIRGPSERTPSENVNISRPSKHASSLLCIHTDNSDDEEDLKEQSEFQSSQKSKSKKRGLKFWKTKRKIGHEDFDKQEKSSSRSITERLRVYFGKKKKRKNIYKVDALPQSQDVTKTASEELLPEAEEIIPFQRNIKEPSSGVSDDTLQTGYAWLDRDIDTCSHQSPVIGKTKQTIPVFIEVSAKPQDIEDDKDSTACNLAEKESLLLGREEEIRKKEEELILREKEINKKENEMKEKEEKLMNMCTRIDRQSKELESILQNPRYIKFSRCRHVTVWDHKDHFEQLRHVLDGLYTKNEELMALLKDHIQNLKSLPESTSDITDMVKKLSSAVKTLTEQDTGFDRDSQYCSQTDLPACIERWGRDDIFSRIMNSQIDMKDAIVQMQKSFEKLATKIEKEE